MHSSQLCSYAPSCRNIGSLTPLRKELQSLRTAAGHGGSDIRASCDNKDCWGLPHCTRSACQVNVYSLCMHIALPPCALRYARSLSRRVGLVSFVSSRIIVEPAALWPCACDVSRTLMSAHSRHVGNNFSRDLMTILLLSTLSSLLTCTLSLQRQRQRHNMDFWASAAGRGDYGCLQRLEDFRVSAPYICVTCNQHTFAAKALRPSTILDIMSS